jgi:large subunit ribosomal protein L9
MEIILLERISRLGNVGDTVRVKDGYARNFLLPLKKALRATDANKTVFETKRAALEAQNAESRAKAQALAATMGTVTVTVIRQASEDGKLYGSVAVRDISEALTEAGHIVERRLIDLTTAIKTLGVYKATINLHPEVQVAVNVNVARNAESPLPAELLDAPKTVDAAEEEAAA